MASENRHFQKELGERVDAHFNGHVDAERAKIYAFARDVAVESFKNGLRAGRERSRKAKQSTSQ